MSHSEILLASKKPIAAITRWSKRWKMPSTFPRSVRVVFSSRLTRSLGRCILNRREIRLHKSLQKARKAIFEEVLCHELAHIAVQDKYGPRCKPHGKEWADLVRTGGFNPRIHLYVDELPVRSARTASKGIFYIYRCPVCGATRKSKKHIPRWRCADCIDAGLDGVLEVTSVPACRGK